MAAPATPASGIEVYAKSDGRLYAKNASGNEYDLTGGPGATTISGVQTLLHMDATATSEIVSDVTESAARKTFTLPANDYDDIIVEFGVQQRVEQDATTRCDFTWRIKVGGTTERTYIERVIAMNTAGADSGNRSQSVLMHRFAGGQGSPTAITITSQHSLSNPDTGSTVQWMRVYGVKDYAIVGEQGPPGADGAQGPAGPTGASGADGVGVPAGGTTGQILSKASSTDHDTEWVDAPSGGGGTQVDVITVSNASHPVPLGAKFATIQMWGGGGGGGSGHRRAAGFNRSGGGGGGRGYVLAMHVDVGSWPSEIDVTIGAGGAGGAAITADTTNGLPGGIGGNTSIVAGAVTVVRIGGGGGGEGGNTSSGTGGTSNGAELYGLNAGNLGAGGTGNVAAGGNGVAGLFPLPTGGGGGGGINSSNVASAGGTGGRMGVGNTWKTPVISGGLANGGNGSNGYDYTNSDLAQVRYSGGTGGGGGGGGTPGGGTGGNGGNGGLPSGGGGGGGASVNGSNSGKGGDGGNGMVVIIWYF
jgi:hypothetical protein